MALPQALQLDGPPQTGKGVQGRYVYWICMAFPHDDTVEATGVKTPADFDHNGFREVVAESHTACGVELVETACFREPHASGKPHLNLLVRAKQQYRWKRVAQHLLEHHKVHVGFGSNVKTWAEGVVYGRVGSEHKPPECLDQQPVQWHAQGTPTPFEQFLPRKWAQPGLVRKTQLSNLAFYDACREHNLTTETQVWAKATELSQKGDRGLLAYAMENDVENRLAKVLKATSAQESARRETLTREALLEEFVAKNMCCCTTSDQCYDLMQQVLVANGLDGTFQAEVLGALAQRSSEDAQHLLDRRPKLWQKLFAERLARALRHVPTARRRKLPVGRSSGKRACFA